MFDQDEDMKPYSHRREVEQRNMLSGCGLMMVVSVVLLLWFLVTIYS